ncbi:MAG: hypothetical protein KDN19_20135, partial [Verrucomicrobiae bacterium]|nr:hypothetical protein [Verrucomicrobiae bacterium]
MNLFNSIHLFIPGLRRRSCFVLATLLMAGNSRVSQASNPVVTKLHGRVTISQSDRRFGECVAISDRYLLVGEPRNSDVASVAGAVHLYDARTGRYLRKLTASDGEADDRFGTSVSLEGDVAIIGAPGDGDLGFEAGAVYVFNVRTGTQLAKLTAADGTDSDWFGDSVSLSGNLALIGAPQDDAAGNFSGSAYVFELLTGSQLVKLIGSNSQPFDEFGYSVSLSGNLALVGARLGTGLSSET